MSLFSGKAVSLWGTGMHVPERILTNQELEQMVDTSNEWILERTGIRERHIIAPEEQTSDLAVEAGRIALERAGLAPEELDMVIVATNSPDTIFPCTAAKVQGKLGAKKAGAFDVQSGCTGCVYALTVAVSGIAAGVWRHVLVVGAEALSRLINWQDRNTCVLFGDGAGACVLGPRREGDGRFVAAALRADGTKHDLISLPASGSERPASKETLEEGAHFVHMKGNEVFKFVNRELPPFLQSFCESSGVEPGHVDWWIFHQANWRIMEGILRRFGVSPERAVVNLDRYGNTSAASVFLALCEALDDGRIRKGQKMVINSFGAGMTYGAILLEV
jgi:3-oxoacyl-[acyl-carrier-protein] synthase-3